ncbi:MAG: mechanosensitive ion channel family protein, partial [Bacteroidota bacterium]
MQIEEQMQSSWTKLVEKLSGWVESMILGLPNFVIAVIVFLLAWWISRVVQTRTERVLSKFFRQVSVRALIANVISFVTIVLGLLLALSVMNLDGTIKSLLAGAGVAGLAISLALQGTLSNTFSGVFIAIRDEINVGDWIETNGFSGKVVSIDLRNTKVKEADNNIVVIPNNTILNNPFKNYALTSRIRTHIDCGVAYDTDLANARQVAINAIESVFPPSSGEEIEFYYTNFNNSSIDFTLRFWVDAKENLTALQVKSK